MDPNEGNNESVNQDIFEAVAEANHELYERNGTPQKSLTDPAQTGETGGGKAIKSKTKEQAEDLADNSAGKDEQDFSHQPVPSIAEDQETKTETETETETAKESETDSELKTETETKTVVDEDWRVGLPGDPGEFLMKAPEPDEFGQINPQDYSDYIRAQIRHDGKVDKYNADLITKTFDVVDSILPEIKENSAYQSAIRNTYFGTLSPEDTVNLAKEFRSTIDKIAGDNKTKGIQSAKTSITILKNAAVETKGATQKKSDTSKSDNLTKRLQKNETSAYEELMESWLEEGKV